MKTAFCLLLLVAGAASGAPPEDRVFDSHLMVDQEVVVCGRVTGVVASIVVDRGSAVTQGQVLANLDPRELDAEVRQAKEEMDLKKAEYDRAVALHASRIVSSQDLDEKKAQYQVAVATWEKAKAIREYAVVRAPFAGIVTEKYARLGQKVIEDRNEPLFKITATEPLLARIYMPEEELLRVRLNDRVEVIPDRFPGAKTTGEVKFISPTVDPASGTFQVMIQVRRLASQPALRPGIAVKVRFLEGKPH